MCSSTGTGDRASTLLTEINASTFATSHYAKGSLRWIAPELVNVSEVEDLSPNVTPSVHSDVYSFGGLMLQVCCTVFPLCLLLIAFFACRS